MLIEGYYLHLRIVGMNRKIIFGMIIASVIIASLGVITVVKTTLGDKPTELPGEEGMENTLNLQEGSERGESTADEAIEYGER